VGINLVLIGLQRGQLGASRCAEAAEDQLQGDPMLVSRCVSRIGAGTLADRMGDWHIYAQEQ
jgi:uncharacterized Fe-S cluster-containing protein